MRTIKIFTIILLLMLLNQKTFSYGILITNPCVSPESPSPYYHPVSSISVDFRLDTIHISDSRFARCKIYVVQGYSEVLMFNEIVEAGRDLSTPIDPVNFPGLSFNEPFKIKITAASGYFPNLIFEKFAYAILYKEGMGKEFGSISSNDHQLISNGMAGFESSNSCRTLSTGIYSTKQYILTYTLTGNFTDSIPEVVSEYSLGYNGALPNYQHRWAYKISQTATEAKFINFVYHTTNTLGQDLGFYPCNIQQARIVYKYASRPVIGSVIQHPNPLTQINNLGLIICNLRQGSDSVTYEWRDSNNIHHHELTPMGNILMIRASFQGSSLQATRQEYFTVHVRAHNYLGYSNWWRFRVSFGSDPHGCPTITSDFNGYTIKDNPILNRSPDESGRDVTDYYMLNDPLNESHDSVTFGIIETDNYVKSRIDKLGLMSVSVDKNKEVSVTEEGELVDYKIDPSKNTVYLNSKDDVTGVLMNNDNEILQLMKGDDLDINFKPDNEESHIILRIRTTGIKNLDAGIITTPDGVSRNFICRSGFSNVCIKLNQRGFSGFKLSALQDCEIDQIAVVKNENDRHAEKLELINAFNENGSIIKQILYPDKLYAYVTAGNDSKFIFKNNLNNEKRTFYVAEITGVSKNGNIENDDQNVSLNGKYEFKLYENLPNPFNPLTKLSYEVPGNGYVRLAVYDIAGREIKTLVNEFKSAGKYEVMFNGSSLASGVYFCRLTGSGQTSVRRVILVK